MIILLTKLVIGFSVFSAAILLIAYVSFIKDMRKTPASMLACALLLISLSSLQLWHWQFLETGFDLFTSQVYVFFLLLTPPMFYFFSREILLPESKLAFSDLIHLLPLSLAFEMPPSLVIPVALTIGAAYSIWLVRIVFGLRRQVRRFKFELFFFGFFAVLAVIVLALAVLTTYLPNSVFYIAYANMTGLAMILVVSALISFPELLNDISTAAEMAYSSSTLKNVDREQKLEQLDRVMSEDKLFQNENLNLQLLSSAVDLSAHQLSELINSHYDYGFSRYVRERRVAEAERLLRDDRNASILSISLTTGFKSQSNFYTAFREVTGESPGEFRKKL